MGWLLLTVSLAALGPAAFSQNFAQTQEVRVLELKFFPLDPASDGTRLDPSIAGTGSPLASIREHVATLSAALADSLTRASVYVHDPEGLPSVGYRVVESLEQREAVPVSQPGQADHSAMLDGRYTFGRGICSYVDDGGVSQVWIWMYHTDHATPVESNMAMGTESSRYFTHGGYGDVSNSYRLQDLPVCRKSYVVFEYNYTRGLAEAMEDHGHQYEALFSFVDPDIYFSRYLGYGDDSKREAYRRSVIGTHVPRAVHCGNTHSPPNTVTDYDWANPLSVLAACDWEEGEPEIVSCSNWSCRDEGGISYKIWWMRRFPGRGNKAMVAGRRMRNWWEFVADFDEALSQGKSLLGPPVTPPASRPSLRPFDWSVVNDERHRYAVLAEDKKSSRKDEYERKSFEAGNLILENSVADPYILNILAGWQLGKDNSKAIANLVTLARRYPDLKALSAASYLKAAQTAAADGHASLARRLFRRALEVTGAPPQYHREAERGLAAS